MRILLFILLIIGLTSCNKEVTNKFDLKCVELEMERPGLTVSATVTSSTGVLIQWQKKGRNTYTVQRKGSDGVWTNVYSCQCGYYSDIISPGTYSYRVFTGSTFSNIVTITTTAPNTPPAPPRVIKIAFDPHYIEYWNAFLFDTTLLGSGLADWQRDSIMSHVRNAFSAYDLTFVTSGDASQTCVLTESSSWFGSSGGVAYIGSYGQSKECFVFSQLLSYNWRNIVKATVHELGHTLGLYHTQDLGLVDNWMSYAYSVNQFFYTTVDVYGTNVNQPQIINTTIQ